MGQGQRDCPERNRREKRQMSKTVLRNIRLVNWYGFTNTTIPVSENLTLISGENECGKSTILDAVKYAYTGDTQFNKATSGYNTGVGKRNLVSYTRCLVDASSGIYARPAEKIPAVYTHIALEYYDQINENPFILGVIIETAVTDIRGNYWYAFDGKTLEEIDYVYEENSILKPYDASGFQKRYGVQLKNKKDGITLFMQMTGLKLAWHDVPKYQRKLRNIMAYNPAAKIQEFIKESVLEEHNVNFDKLKDAKQNIEKVNQTLEQIDQELRDLDAILKDFDEHDRRALRLRIDDIKLKYKNVVTYRAKRGEAEETVNRNRTACDSLEKRIREESGEIEEIEMYYTEAKSALREMDVSKAILASEQLVRNYEQQLEALEKEKEALEAFQRKVRQILERMREAGEELPDNGMSEKLTAKTVEVAEKKAYIEDLKHALQTCRDNILAEKGAADAELSRVQRECTEQVSIIETCEKNKADFSYAKEQTELIREINREFSKRGIREEAHMACEYVAGLEDEEWRDAIEAFLGIHRYAVVVDPAFFDIANEVMDRSSHRYVELVNTKRLMEKEIRCREDSVYHFLQIRNEAAAKYFMFWLGGIHAVDKKDVPKYDNAMSKEGKLSRNMAVTYINTKKLRSYCLGSEAIELNKRKAERRLQELEDREKKLLKFRNDQRDKAEFLQEGLNGFREYDLNAHSEAARITAELEKERARWQELIEAQRDNAEFAALSDRVSILEKQLREKKKVRDSHQKEKVVLEAEAETKENEIREYRAKEEEAGKQIEEERARSRSVVETAVREYDRFLSGEDKEGGLMQPSTKERSARRVRELAAMILASQQSYNNRKQDMDRLPVGLEYESVYQKRRGKIWIDDLQGIQQKLKEQTLKYERIFKREFVLNIYEAAKSARSDIADINKELRKLRFSTKYQFDVKMLSDSSDYAKILRYAEYLQESNDMGDGQIILAAVSGYDSDEVESREKEIKDIINKIIEKNDMTEMRRFADYRNYMSYEIIINNDEVKDGKLSKQVGYNSGAGTQIPYTLILSAALSMLYNVRVNSVRLLFIDEPFEKMSDHNIKLMLDFFKNQDFQVIFCAPPNKLESIGNECGVIIPVLKISNDNMQIGKVKFHEQ